MTDSIKDIEILIGKSISGNTTPIENKELKNWMAASDANQIQFNQTLKAWEKSKNLLSDSEIKEDRFKIQVDINKKLLSKFQKSKKRNLIFKIAAILAIPVSLALGWYIFQNSIYNLNDNQYCEITSPKGNISKCLLPDGTEVWVNTNSTISYNSNFSNQEIREVKLDGEAYFHVTSNKQKPFIVSTKFGNINVTGTEFNVKSYSESYQLETVLVEGSVELQINTNIKQLIKLVPGERVVYKSRRNKINITKVDTEIYSSWRNGEIIFKDATLDDLIQKLENIYDIKFCLDDEKIGEFRFRGMFRYNNNLIDALEKIKKTADLDYCIENKEVRLTKK